MDGILIKDGREFGERRKKKEVAVQRVGGERAPACASATRLLRGSEANKKTHTCFFF